VDNYVFRNLLIEVKLHVPDDSQMSVSFSSKVSAGSVTLYPGSGTVKPGNTETFQFFLDVPGDIDLNAHAAKSDTLEVRATPTTGTSGTARYSLTVKCYITA
jgi:hypothetical protein